MICQRFLLVYHTLAADGTYLGLIVGRVQSGRRGSNSQPQTWKDRTLPIELLPHFVFGTRGRARTGTPVGAQHFKCGVSTNSTTRATSVLLSAMLLRSETENSCL